MPIHCNKHNKQNVFATQDHTWKDCTAYKTHAMATHHGGTGHPIARDNLHIEDPEMTGLDDDNDSISGPDATAALG